MTHKQEKHHPIKTDQDMTEKMKLANRTFKASIIL